MNELTNTNATTIGGLMQKLTGSVSFLDRIVYGNTVRAWLIALGVAAVTVVGLWLLRRLLQSKVGRLVKRTQIEWDDIILELLQRTQWWFLAMIGLYAGARVLSLTTNLQKLIDRGAAVVLVLQGGLWASTTIGFLLENYRRRKLKDDPAGLTTMNAIAFLARVALWSLILLLALANAGVEIGPLIAGLGVGGIAVALAVQTVLGDLLASLSIVLDKPFVIGDFLIIGDFLGSVEYIGLKTTRIRSLTGEQLVFSNTDLLSSRIRNFGRMRERRVVFTIGVTYQTPREKLVRIPQILKAAIESQEMTRFDRSHFKAYGDFSLNFETVYYVAVPDYNKYMDTQQAINLYIHEQFEKEGIEFAYPTQTVFVVNQTAEAG